MHSAGDDQISVPVKDPSEAQSLARTLRETGDWIDAVGGIDSVIVRFDLATTSRASAKRRLEESLSRGYSAIEVGQSLIEIPVVYGGEHGPDLEMLCEQLALTRPEFIALHSGEYIVDMLGFTPGFAYIGGLDDRLVVDRLAEPRQHVPAGSIGIAGGRSGLYSLPGPGGWPLIGRTSRTLFDVTSDEPFTLSAGDRVRFVEAVEQ